MLQQSILDYYGNPPKGNWTENFNLFWIGVKIWYRRFFFSVFTLPTRQTVISSGARVLGWSQWFHSLPSLLRCSIISKLLRLDSTRSAFRNTPGSPVTTGLLAVEHQALFKQNVKSLLYTRNRKMRGWVGVKEAPYLPWACQSAERLHK